MKKSWLGVLGTLVACAPHLEPIEGSVNLVHDASLTLAHCG